MTTTWLDVVLVLVVIWSALTGLRAGFARVVVGFAAMLAGLLAGFWCYRIVAAKLSPWVANPALANLLGFLLIFVGALILGSLISALLARLFRWIGLSSFDHFLGGVAGVLRGALLIAVLVDVAVAFAPSPMPQAFEHSRVLPYASQVSGWLVDLAPRELKDAFTEQMENLKQFWAKPRDPRDRIA